MRAQQSRGTTTVVVSLVIVLCLAAIGAFYWVQSANRDREQPTQPSPHAIDQDSGS